MNSYEFTNALLQHEEFSFSTQRDFSTYSLTAIRNSEIRQSYLWPLDNHNRRKS
jgi:hypothetical protein